AQRLITSTIESWSAATRRAGYSTGLSRRSAGTALRRAKPDGPPFAFVSRHDSSTRSRRRPASARGPRVALGIDDRTRGAATRLAGGVRGPPPRADQPSTLARKGPLQRSRRRRARTPAPGNGTAASRSAAEKR